MKMSLGWVVAGVALAYFTFSKRGKATGAPTTTSSDPLGASSAPPEDTFDGSQSARPFSYGSQYGNSVEPVNPLDPNTQWVRTNALYQNMPQGGDPLDTYNSANYQRYGSVY